MGHKDMIWPDTLRCIYGARIWGTRIWSDLTLWDVFTVQGYGVQGYDLTWHSEMYLRYKDMGYKDMIWPDTLRWQWNYRATAEVVFVYFLSFVCLDNPLVCSCRTYRHKLWFRQNRKWMDLNKRSSKVTHFIKQGLKGVFGVLGNT